MNESLDVEEPEGPVSRNGLATDVPPEKPIEQTVVSAMLKQANRLSWAGGALFVLATLVGLGLLYAAFEMTSNYIEIIRDARQDENPELLLILVLVRGTFFGGLSIAILYGLFTIANACVDQATRFRKRAYSAHMLNFAFKEYGDQIASSNKVRLADLVALFGAWNENVDSAFSRVKFQNRTQRFRLGHSGLAAHDGPKERESSGEK